MFVFLLGCIGKPLEKVYRVPYIPYTLNFLHSEEPNFIYKCFGIALACPGGEPGTCAEGCEAGFELSKRV